VYVDDATSRLMELAFAEVESTFDYFRATREYLEEHGRPMAFYSDRLSVFHVQARERAHAGSGVSQFGRALRTLNINLLCARSPEAKGRVERANGTLQDRLVEELRSRGLNEPVAAAPFLPVFRADYNRRFAKPPAVAYDAHRPLRPDDDRVHPHPAGDPADQPALPRRGLRATSHWLALDRLQEFSAEPTHERVVEQGRSSPPPACPPASTWRSAPRSGLRVTTWHRRSSSIEYDPRPPIAAGSPDKAPRTSCRFSAVRPRR